MSNVRFENQGEEYGPPPTSSSFDLTSFMTRTGLVSTRQEAQYVMIGVAVLAFAGAFFLFVRSTGDDVPPPPPPNLAPQTSYQ